MRYLALLLLLLAACGIPNPLELVEPTSGCLGPFYTYPGGTLNHEAILRNEAVLKYLFTHEWSYTDSQGNWYTNGPLLGSNKEFCESFGGIHITYQWDYQFQCSGVPPYNECWGYTNLNGITLEYSGRALAHELIHVYETERGVWNSSTHPNWDKKGYYFLNDVLWDSQLELVMTGPDGGSYPP